MESPQGLRLRALCILLMAIGIPVWGLAQVSSTAPSCPRWINADPGNGGSVAWTNLPGAQCDADEARAASQPGSFPTHTQAIRFTNFGLAIPADATITGIEATLVRRAGYGVSLTDHTVQLIRQGVPAGQNKRLGTAWDHEWTGVTYGGQQDAWGASWTPADLNSPTFGCIFAAALNGPEDRAEIDQVLLVVYYHQPASAAKAVTATTRFTCAPFRP